jgi:hypothetical protein
VVEILKWKQEMMAQKAAEKTQFKKLGQNVYVVMIFKYGKRFRFASLFNKKIFVGPQP